MKTFTKFFAFLFAFMLLGSISVNAQLWTAPSGDASKPVMEIFVYGASLNGTPIADGDQIAAFDGTTLVGVLTVDITAPATTIDLTNWISNRLLVYNRAINGDTLYHPGHPILLKAWNGTEYYAYTWGDAQQIDFHETWWAPTSDQIGANYLGAFYPPQGANSYCYTNLTFVAGDPLVGVLPTVTVTVFESDGSTPVNGAVVSSGGYTGTTAGAGVTPAIKVYWAAGTINYTFKVEAAGHTTEIFTVAVDAIEDNPVSVTLDSYGTISGTVEYDDPILVPHQPAFGAVISTTIGDTTYTDWADASGNYSISGIPDGTWTFKYTYPEYTTQEFSLAIADGAPLDNDVLLLPQTGTLEGEIFDATTLQLIKTADIDVELWQGGVMVEEVTSDVNGAYASLTAVAGTYDIHVIPTATYKTLIIPDYVLLPSEDAVTENFNLVLTTYTQHFTAVTGDPNNMWTIQIESAKFGSSSFLPYDELSIWDTLTSDDGTDDVLVGTLVFDRSATWQNSGSNVLKAFAVLSNGSTGFTPGNNIEFRAYDVSQGAEAGVPVSWSFNEWMGTYHGTTFPNLTTYPNPVSYLNIYWDFPSGVLIGTVTRAENPNIDDPIAGVTVNVLNQFTQEVVGTGTTNASGQYNIPLDQGTFDVKFSVANFKTVIVKDVEIILGENTTENEALFNRLTASQDYSFAGPGFFFFGRCVESTVTDMTDLFDNHGTGSLGAALFSQDYQASWIENDAGTQMTYFDATTWTNEFPWDLKEGYQLFIASADATDHGTYTFDLIDVATERYLVEPEDNPITFTTAGIYYIPYFPWDYTDPDDAITAFASILDKIDWVMDSEGNRLHKNNGNWVDNIGVLSPEAGYKIKTTNLTALTFTYPAAATKSAGSTREMLSPVHFIYNEGNAADWTYTMYINTNEFAIGDEIAAYSNGIMVGSMVINTEDAWENELNTFYAAVEGGYETNTPIELMAWDASDGNEYTVGFEMVAINNNAYIGTMYPAGLDHFSYVNVYRGIVRVDENQIDNHVKVYPNPTNGTLNIESVSNINELRIYNVYGALVAVTNVNAKQQSVDVSNYTPGTYLVQLHTDTGVITKRVVVR